MVEKDKAERKGGLGKGIHSLLGDVGLEGWPLNRPQVGGTDPQASLPPQNRETANTDLQIRLVDPALIDPNPDQPRKVFKEDELAQLAASVAEDGILQPLLVMENKLQGERYTLLAGERRLRAAKIAGLKTVPVIIKETNAEERLRLALIENIQRADLSIIEEAEAYRSLISDYGLTQEQCAQKVGKDRSTVANALRILTLPLALRDDLVAGRLSVGHAKALLTLEDAKVQLQARELILHKHLSVRKTEQLCKSLLDEAKTGSDEPLLADLDPDMAYIADNLRSYLRTKVKLAGNAQRGKIEISYFSSTEFERLLGLIGHKL